MTGERRGFRREGEERRRDALIAAVLDLVADGGAGAATVRAIADRAGVTPGLIRHYFGTKEALVQTAYRAMMDRMTEANLSALEGIARPEARLAAFVAATLRPPMMDPGAVGLWAGFIHRVRRDPALAAVHAATYLGYRDQLQRLIAALPGQADPDRLRQLAIACNGMIDGLWLEGGALPDAFAADELARIGVDAVAALVGADLMAHFPPAPPLPTPAPHLPTPAPPLPPRPEPHP